LKEVLLYQSRMLRLEKSFSAHWSLECEQLSMLELDCADVDLACLMLGFMRA